ncbi:LysR family transcriptional regulator [Paraburkholderia silviterrae]|uniref:LysR family transcriptional regulator n=1 Tax=Paraburkholderia silviterrae TaxID=2528715 RepID=A0A4R5M868_9BURK|nr:LysR family transcriptional regulator [Paraburkholderia silviterrae]TDG21806.1 LysR family transcriptional regulator [Paraburkholderia silviterrae]
MDTLQSMRIFVRIAEEGSFARAAERMDISRAVATRAVAWLETHLRARLLNRTTRRIALTETGQRYLQRCQQILTSIRDAEVEASDALAKPAGRLRVHAMLGFGQTYLVPALMRYQEYYPSVSVDLNLSHHLPRILDEGCDVAVWMAGDQLPDSGFVSQRLGTLHSVLCASPAYLEDHGAPEDVADLAQHSCIPLVSSLFPRGRWDLDGPDGPETFELPPTAFQVNVPEVLGTVLQEGKGIGALPMPSAVPLLKSGALARVLPNHQLQKLTGYVQYPSRQYLDAKVRTFVEFLREIVPPALASDHAALH